MKILITNPDSIGDFVLRQPLFAALSGAGHELLLVTRSFVGPLSGLVAPGAAVAHCALNPYDSDFANQLGDLEPLVRHCREFAPQYIVVAPYQRTLLDEYLLECFPDVPSYGLSGRLFRGSPDQGQNQTSTLRFDTRVETAEDEAELRKNELLCSAVLGRNVTLPPPALAVDAEAVEQARLHIAKLGLRPDRTWAVALGHNQWTALRNWPIGAWQKTLGAILERHEIDLLFVGTEDEHEVAEAVRTHVDPHGRRSATVCNVSLSLPALVALIAASQGFVGRDTGPMHLAAALEKPVFAVFGGGTWPRFIPAANSGCALTVEVPCRGCDWHCHLPESVCVKTVAPADFIRAFDEAVRAPGPFRVHRPEASPELLRQMVSDAWATADERSRESNALLRNLSSRAEALESGLETEHSSVVEQRSTIQHLQRQVDELAALAGRSEGELQRREFELSNVRQDWEATREESERLRDLLAMLKSEHSKLGAESSELKESLASIRSDLEALNARYRELEAAHADSTAKLDSVRQSIFTKILTKLGLWRIFD